jgi:hypothetical protein
VQHIALAAADAAGETDDQRAGMLASHVSEIQIGFGQIGHLEQVMK